MKVTVDSLTEKIGKAKTATKGKEGKELRSKKKVVKRLQRKSAKIAMVVKKMADKTKKKNAPAEAKKEEEAKSE